MISAGWVTPDTSSLMKQYPSGLIANSYVQSHIVKYIAWLSKI